MADTRREEQARRFVSLASGRLAQNRWTLAAGVVAVLAVHFYAGGSALFTAAAILLLVRRDRARPAAHAQPAPGRSGGGGRRRRARRPVRPEPRRCGQRSADHLRRGRQRRPRQRSGALGLRRARARHVAAVEIPRARNAGSDRARAFGRCRIRGRRLCRARSDRARLQGHGLGHRPGHRAFRRRLQGPERERGGSTACAPTSSPTPATNCARRSPRSPASSRRCAGRPGTTPRRAIISCSIMQNQTARMARLIDDLLSLSRLEMKPYLPPGAAVDVRPIVQSVIDSLSPLAKEFGVVIERKFGDAPVEVRGDRDELFQVFENLLENACKYGQSGGRVVVSIEHGRRARSGSRGHDPRFRPGHSGRAHSAHHRAVLPRRCRHQPRPERHRARPCHRQAHPDPPQCAADHQVGGGRGGCLHGASAGEVRPLQPASGCNTLRRTGSEDVSGIDMPASRSSTRNDISC